jgi:hypothetical protein
MLCCYALSFVATGMSSARAGMKSRAWKAWRALWQAARASASRFTLAARHHRTRRLGLCFGLLLALWRAHRELLERAKRFRAVRAVGVAAEVLAGWRELVGELQWKNIRMRRCGPAIHGMCDRDTEFGWEQKLRPPQAMRQGHRATMACPAT